jgi:hypothetical protein
MTADCEICGAELGIGEVDICTQCLNDQREQLPTSTATYSAEEQEALTALFMLQNPDRYDLNALTWAKSVIDRYRAS